jgi:hypothetical protein
VAQFEKELGPLSDEETKVSRKFIKFILEFAVKGIYGYRPFSVLFSKQCCGPGQYLSGFGLFKYG